GRGLARGAVGSAFDAKVAVAPFAAAGCDHGVAGAGQILKHVTGPGVGDDRARRQVDHEVMPVAAMAIGAAAALAVFGAPVLAHGECGQAIDPFDGSEDDASAVAAIAAVGTAAGNVLLSAKAQAAVAAAAGFEFDGDAIDEHAR